MTQFQVDKARGLLRELLGKEIALHPIADGAERYLTAEVSGDYAGLLRLALENNGGGGQPLHPSLMPALPFKVQGIALAA